jgi:glycosyltransferase involved in cell wall biosynthesis
MSEQDSSGTGGDPPVASPKNMGGSPMPRRIPCSVLLLTLNEEINLPRCLESLKWCDDIVVLDSFSTDRSVEIAKEFGARIIQRKFDNWSAHQNWAVANIKFKYPWVYYTDADEVVPPELAQAIDSIISAPDRKTVAYGIRRKEMFRGRWLRHSSMYPVWILRLFRPERIRWERLVNPVARVDGPTIHLQRDMIHYSFSKGLHEWVEKHNKYAQFEAAEAMRVSKTGIEDFWGIFSVGDPLRRRKAMKAMSYRMPLRPLLKFIYMYFLRLGILDGRAGLTYCRLIAMYEFFIDLNVKELRRREKGLPL